MRKLRRDRPYSQSSATTVAVATTSPVFSSRSLDLMSLALCSCALTLLCHSAANLPSSGATANNSMAAQSGATQNVGASVQPFTLTSPRPSVKADDAEE
jgi:hypothetical protein